MTSQSTNAIVHYSLEILGYTSYNKEGKDYYELVRTYQITFSVHNIFKHNGYITRASLRTSKGIQISDQIHLIFIELGKLDEVLDKQVEEMTSLEMWSTVLGYSGDPAKRGLINKILEQKEELGMAGTILAAITKDEHERAKRMSERKWETDMQHNTLVREKIARAEGEKLGEKRERKKWQAEIADKDAEIADKDALIAELQMKLKEEGT